MSLLLLLAYCKTDYIFRSLANGNSMYSSISLLLVGNNSLVDEIKCLTPIELYFHSECYGKHCCFESAELSQRDWFVTYEDKYHENADVAAFNHLKIISYLSDSFKTSSVYYTRHNTFSNCYMSSF